MHLRQTIFFPSLKFIHCDADVDSSIKILKINCNTNHGFWYSEGFIFSGHDFYRFSYHSRYSLCCDYLFVFQKIIL